jgi:hypothetical protein
MVRRGIWFRIGLRHKEVALGAFGYPEIVE